MQLTPEILEERRGGIGGSDSGVIMGKSKYATPLKIYLSKIEDQTDENQTNQQKWGHIMEPVIRCIYEEEKQRKVKQFNKILRNPKFPWMLANIDGWVCDNKGGLSGKLLEIKNTRFAGDWGELGTDSIPDTYLIQCAHYAIVCDETRKIDSVDIAVLIGGSDFRIYTYKRCKEFEQIIIDRTHNFWYNHVQTKIPPEPQSAEDILKLYKPVEDKKIMCDAMHLPIVRKHKIVSNAIKRLDKQQKKLAVTIQAYMKDAEILVDNADNKLCTLKDIVCRNFSTKDFRAANEASYKKFLRESRSRRFNNLTRGGNKNGD